MKPCLWHRSGTWYCAGRIYLGIGSTPMRAYLDWMVRWGSDVLPQR